MEMVKKAYEKLDVNKDGSVRLDDIAKIYDASCSQTWSLAKRTRVTSTWSSCLFGTPK